jgi:hypothetical protein
VGPEQMSTPNRQHRHDPRPPGPAVTATRTGSRYPSQRVLRARRPPRRSRRPIAVPARAQRRVPVRRLVSRHACHRLTSLADAATSMPNVDGRRNDERASFERMSGSAGLIQPIRVRPSSATTRTWRARFVTEGVGGALLQLALRSGGSCRCSSRDELADIRPSRRLVQRLLGVPPLVAPTLIRASSGR